MDTGATVNGVVGSAKETGPGRLTPGSAGALVDLLERVLDRGLVLDADLVITLAGVPLVAISLRAALAGVETMTACGPMDMRRRWALAPPADSDAILR